MFGRKLVCSFCGKGEADVAKLLTGPRVYICDQCAAEVIRIMDQPTHTDGPLTTWRTGLSPAVLARIRGLWCRGIRHVAEHHATAQSMTHAV